MRSKIDKILEIVLILVITGVTFEWIYIYFHRPGYFEFGQSEEREKDKLEIEKQIKEEQPENSVKEIVLPESFNLDIPFISQSPLEDWNPPFDHACEEAAILMVHYYLQNKSTIEPTEVTQEIRQIVDFETKTYGFYQDTSTEQTAQVIRDYYGYNVKYPFFRQTVSPPFPAQLMGW
ncbi:MAG: hypothetical protein QMC93_01940 [Patescibacteria group bacterium]|nr:hypothetical protein [Patescibacteria group bacterium]